MLAFRLVGVPRCFGTGEKKWFNSRTGHVEFRPKQISGYATNQELASGTCFLEAAEQSDLEDSRPERRSGSAHSTNYEPNDSQKQLFFRETCPARIRSYADRAPCPATKSGWFASFAGREA